QNTDNHEPATVDTAGGHPSRVQLRSEAGGRDQARAHCPTRNAAYAASRRGGSMRSQAEWKRIHEELAKEFNALDLEILAIKDGSLPLESAKELQLQHAQRLKMLESRIQRSASAEHDRHQAKR